ncbi:MAG: helix-turn-helix transcriptional regulator [bacterium]
MTNRPKSELCRRIGCEVYRRRHARGWSQEKLAEHADCTRNTISFVERGLFNVSAEMLLNLAKAFGTNIQGFSRSAKI